MVKGLVKVEDDTNNGEGNSGLLQYFRMANIREELTSYIGVEDGMQLQDLLLDKQFEQTYELLDEHWEESVRQKVSEEELDGWEPEKPLQA